MDAFSWDTSFLALALGWALLTPLLLALAATLARRSNP